MSSAQRRVTHTIRKCISIQNSDSCMHAITECDVHTHVVITGPNGLSNDNIVTQYILHIWLCQTSQHRKKRIICTLQRIPLPEVCCLRMGQVNTEWYLLSQPRLTSQGSSSRLQMSDTCLCTITDRRCSSWGRATQPAERLWEKGVRERDREASLRPH